MKFISLVSGSVVVIALGSAPLGRAATPAPEPAPAVARVSARPTLRAIVLLPDTANLDVTVARDFSGVDATRTPLLSPVEVNRLLEPFVGAPLLLEALEPIVSVLRRWLQSQGHPFVVATIPPQDVTDGVLRVVMARAKLDRELTIEGAKYFSAASYRRALPLVAGADIDAGQINAGVAWLNASPYRRVTIAAEPGAVAGTTKLTLRAQETRPWQFTTGYSNTGTAITDENRVSAGVTWGNAFGRGDTLGYNFTADPALEHSRSHSANYGTTFRSGRSLTAFGAYSTIESALPEPLTQAGTSWQVGVRHGVPLAKAGGGWERSLNFSADFKYSDNNLEFAAIPITNNVTHVAQLGATFSISRRTAERNLALSASLYASPGGLTGRNHDRDFDVSRAGARAEYLYGRIEGQFAQRLPHGFSFTATAALQAASDPLLGTEQLNGGGSSGVRGYRESTAFGDEGALVNTELHLPVFSPFKARDQADFFAFVDAAALHNNGPDGGNPQLTSAGLGLNYQFGRHFSLRAAYGWTLKDLPNVLTPSGRGHLSATMTW